MKKLLIALSVLSFLFVQKSFSQTDRTPGPAEKKITDSLCAALNRLDMSKIGNGQEAETAFMDCFMKQSAMFEDVANERNVQMDDNAEMHKIGIDIGKNLLRMKCDAFLKLAAKMANKDKESGDGASAGSIEGNFKRIDNKGFNYFVIADNDKKEKSFIWLRQFQGSENFMNGGANYIGKRVKIRYQEMEVYLPQAKGYYKVKEIISLDIQ